MNRDVAAVAVVALLAILALAAASATLDSTVSPGPGDGVDTPGNVTPIYGNGSGGLGGTFPPGSDTGEREEPPDLCFPVLNEPPVIGLFVGAWLVLVVGTWRRYYAELAGAVGIFAGLWGLISHQFLADCGGQPSRPPPLAGVTPKPQNTPTPAPTVTPGNGSAGGVASVTEPSLAMGVLVLALLVVGLLVVYRMSGDTDLEMPDGPDEGDEADVGAIGSVAGEAADRIEAAGEVENEVYRAWREMTTYLAVDAPDASTPGEFAAAAVAAGMAERDVAELTRLFEEVRYGDRPADEDRSERAVSALRRIEAEYGEAGTAVPTDEPDTRTDAPTDAGDEGTGEHR